MGVMSKTHRPQLVYVIANDSESMVKDTKMFSRYIDFGGTGTVLHLATANGFPPEAYTPLAAPLISRQRMVGYRSRPLWPGSQPEEVQSWHDLGSDLGTDLNALTNDPVVGMGHSLGGIMTLYAALRHPERFKALVLLDPVILERRMLLLIKVMRQMRVYHRNPLVQGALRRRAHFPSAEVARQRYRGRGIFANWDDAALEGYLAGGLRPAPEGGVTLAWPTAWEAHIFSLVPLDAWEVVMQVRQPLLIIRGKRSDVVTDPVWAGLQRRLPHATLVELDAGHMVPMEQPHAVATVVQEFLKG